MATLYRGIRRDPRHPWRNENLGRLLLAALDRWQNALVEKLQEAGFPDFRYAHMSLLRHIDIGGTRLTEIAERAGVTKQAVGKLVVVCEELGLVEMAPDPSDGRAKIVSFTERGRAVIVAERNIMERIDAALAARLGGAGFAQLRRTLAVLADSDVLDTAGREADGGERQETEPRVASSTIK